MSHLGTRLLADALASTDYGIDAVLAKLAEGGCLHGSDPAPTGSVSVYDDTRDGWVARGLAPEQNTEGVSYPCVRVMTLGVDYSSGTPATESTNARTIRGTLQVALQLLLVENDTEDASRDGMYLLRAIRGVIACFDHHETYAARVACGLRLEPATGIRQGNISAPVGDTIMSPGGFVISYPFTEEVPIS